MLPPTVSSFPTHVSKLSVTPVLYSKTVDGPFGRYPFGEGISQCWGFRPFSHPCKSPNWDYRSIFLLSSPQGLIYLLRFARDVYCDRRVVLFLRRTPNLLESAHCPYALESSSMFLSLAILSTLSWDFCLAALEILPIRCKLFFTPNVFLLSDTLSLLNYCT